MFVSKPGSKRRILFFIDGPVPSAADQALADTLTSTRRIVMFRNAQGVGKEDGPERSDFICSRGVIPPQYLVRTKSFEPAEVIDLNQPELALSEVAPSAVPMAAVSSAPVAEVPPPAPATDTPSSDLVSAASAPITAPVATDPLADITAEEVEGLKVYNIEAVVKMVANGELSRERAAELERRGKNRPTLLKRLTDSVD
jgi:hypothetical protein